MALMALTMALTGAIVNFGMQKANAGSHRYIFGINNCLPSHVAKWECVAMPHGHCWLDNTTEYMFWQLL